jgi:hypothetical protein
MKQIPKAVQNVENKLANRRDTVFQRFPLLFTLLGTFGVVATFYGFEGIINRVPQLANHPIILLLVGIGTLLVTGTLYKKL